MTKNAKLHAFSAKNFFGGTSFTRRSVFGMMLLILGTFLLSACQAGVTTHIKVTGDTASKITTSVRFEDEAALEITKDPGVEAQLVKLIANRTGNLSPKREETENSITYTTDVEYDQLQKASDVLGIKAAKMSGSENDVILALELVDPQGLKDAITKTASSEPDSLALTAAMLGTTTVSVEVEFPGGIKEVKGPEGVEVELSKNEAVLKQSLSSFVPGNLTVKGDPSASLLSKFFVPVTVGALILTLFYFARRILKAVLGS